MPMTPAATDRDRPIRRSRSMRLHTRPTAGPTPFEADDAEEEGEAEEAQGQGRVRAQSGQSRMRRSRRQCGHTPPQGRAGCFRQRQSQGFFSRLGKNTGR
jgi:hypothetical protein